VFGDEAPSVKRYDLLCSFYGEDVCVISGSELERKGAARLTLGVFCRYECKFKVRAQLQAEINLTPGKTHRLHFGKNQQRIVRFEIPESEEIDEVVFKGISEEQMGQFEMLVLMGNRVPDTSQALILAPAWENGYIGKFYRGCYCFCTGCNYTLLVSSKTEGYIQLGAKISGWTIDLDSFPARETFDAVGFWGLQCYSTRVKDREHDLVVTLQTYSGKPQLYVNPTVPLEFGNLTEA